MPSLPWSLFESTEKMTDANIAVELMRDAFEDEFDVALLVSADSDLTGPVRAVKELFPAKRVTVAFPPARSSKELFKAIASSYFKIGEDKLRRNVFPDQVLKPSGYVIKRPESWR